MSKANKDQTQDTPPLRRVMPWGDLPRSEQQAESGLILVDKDQNVTSHDVVGAMRRLAGTRKVGHGGTLDPMATGLLTVGIGRATKLLTYLSGCEKQYRTTVCLGAATNTEDADGEIITPTADQRKRLEQITAFEIDAAIAGLTGEIMQVPSSFSALKVGGKRSHELARAGAEVHLAARPVTIESFHRLSRPIYHSELFEFPVLTFDVEVKCSAGTYIRALARDLGSALEVGAHLRMLRRTQVRGWNVCQASRVAEYAQLIRRGEQLPMISIHELCRSLFPIVEITAAEAQLLQNGQFIPYRTAPQTNPPMPRQTGAVAAFTAEGKAIALISKRGAFYKPDLQLAE